MPSRSLPPWFDKALQANPELGLPIEAAAGGSVSATAALPLGAVTTTATATVEHPVTASLPLGAVTTTVTATVEHPATAALPLGAVTVAVTATPAVTATADLPLGAVVTAVTATVEHPATAALPLGAVTTTATATVEHSATADLPLGTVLVEATAAGGTTPPVDPGGGIGSLIQPGRPRTRRHRRINATARIGLGPVVTHAHAAVTFSALVDEDELLLILT